MLKYKTLMYTLQNIHTFMYKMYKNVQPLLYLLYIPVLYASENLPLITLKKFNVTSLY